MAGIKEIAVPLHIQRIEKALRLEPFLKHAEEVFEDGGILDISDSEDNEFSDHDQDLKSAPLNGERPAHDILRPYHHPDEGLDKSWYYNVARIRKDRLWLKNVLLSDSSDSSDDDEPLTDQDLKDMLRVHKLQKMCQTKFYVEKDLHRFMHYSASLFSSYDKYYDLQKQAPRKFRRKKVKEGKVKMIKMKKEKMKIKKRKKKADAEDDDHKVVFEERMMKKKMIKHKEADAKRKKLWAHIVRKDVPKTQRQKSSARNNVLEKAKKLAQLCQKEMRREALRSQKTSTQNVPRARRLAREMLVYWKKYDKVEKEHRKRAEKEAMEQRKIDDELREARRQQRKLNFLITQTELYAHFMSRKLKGGGNSVADNRAQEMILKKLDENKRDERMLNVHGGMVFDAEDNIDDYDSEAMKQLALQNAQDAFKKQESMTKAYDHEPPADHPSKIVPLTQEYFDEAYSLANPMLVPEREVAQPSLFNGSLKSYQLKGMNWLVNLYEQGINGILADEMGLGKTVQSIAFLAYLAETNGIWGPFLIVAPASTLHNWQQEVSRFVSDFKVLPYWGNQSDRKSLRKFWNQKQSYITSKDAPFHVLITSYQLVVQDARYFQRIQWQYLVLDEAQAIKSTTSVRWKVLLSYPCRNRLLLTGTPIQNSMAELWALLHFIMPTLFDSHDEFNEWFSKDIESHAENMTGIDQDQLSRLHMILKPFMLRRIKRDVENELSDKIEIKCVCELTSQQRWLYRAVRNKISIDDLVYSSTSSASTTNNMTSNLMNLVMQFRKVCNHPELFERRDVQSPIHLTISSYQIPKLLYREGMLGNCTWSRKRLLTRILGINTPEYIHHSLFSPEASKAKKVKSESFFSFTRFVSVSPEELSTAMLKGEFYRILGLLTYLHETTRIHHTRFWSPGKTKSRHLDQRSLMLWPDSVLCFAAINSSRTLSEMVFTSLTQQIFTHSTHSVKPIIHDKNSTQKIQKTPGLVSPTRAKQLTPSKTKTGPQTPISPTKQQATALSPMRHPPPAYSPQDRAATHPSGHRHPGTPLSPTRRVPSSPRQAASHPLSPTRHSQHSPGYLQSLPAKHAGHPLSPQGGQYHHFAYPSSHLHHQAQHPHAAHQISPPGLSPTRQFFPSHVSPTQKSPTEGSHHKRGQHQGRSGHQKTKKAMTLPTAEKIPDTRHNQPTTIPDFLFLFVPKVVIGPRNFYCSDRSAAYEAEQALHGSTLWQKNLLNYGTTDAEYLQSRRGMLHPPALGGIEACEPPGGWTHIQIPSREILITDSGKMSVMDRLLTRLKAEGHRVLIYSQMTRMIDLLEEYMTYRKHKYMRLDGSSKISDRRDMVADFQSNSDIFVFLLSTRAGGLGINLTAADTVIFYDSDWNPTVDQQAMDRAHRLGQTKQVTVYRLVTKGTIEERILQRAKEKSEIQRMVISGGSFRPDALKPKEVVSLLLDDAEMECKFLQRQAEKKLDEQKKRKERKRKKEVSSAASSLSGEGVKLGDVSAVAAPKAKKGRKRKNPLPEPPFVLEEDSKAGSTTGSLTSQNGAEIVQIKPENGDGDISVADDVSIMSLDEVSVVSGESSLVDNVNNTALTPSSNRLDMSETGSEDLRIDITSPSPSQETTPRGKTRGRPRGRGRSGGPARTRGGGGAARGRGRAGRGRGGGAMAAAAAAMAGAQAASAAAYAAYGFTFQSNTPTSQPPSRNSPVAFGSVPPGNMSHPVARYGNVVSDPSTPSGGTPSVSAENSPARPSYVQSLPGFGSSGS